MYRWISGFVMLLLALALVPMSHADTKLHGRPHYQLHVGDVLDLSYRLTPEYNQSVTIQPDGYASINIAGDVQLEGLTVQQAHDLIVQKVSSRLNNPELNVDLTNFQRPYVVVGGEVQQPGRIELRENLTALQAIMLAGGFRTSARDTKVLLFRHINSDMGEVFRLNLHKIQKTAQLEHDMALQPGDMLMVTPNRVDTFGRYMHATAFSSSFYPQGVVP
jgi:polysaccharide export outer membrane protein